MATQPQPGPPRAVRRRDAAWRHSGQGARARSAQGRLSLRPRAQLAHLLRAWSRSRSSPPTCCSPRRTWRSRAASRTRVRARSRTRSSSASRPSRPSATAGMYPLTRYAHLLVVVEAMTGILGIAVITGLTFTALRAAVGARAVREQDHHHAARRRPAPDVPDGELAPQPHRRGAAARRDAGDRADARGRGAAPARSTCRWCATGRRCSS